MSFSAATKVLLASGAAIPISKLTPGDEVLATNVRTGKTSPEPVTAVLLHHDTDRYDLTVKTAHGTAVIDTTSSHLFWNPYPHYGWIPATQVGQDDLDQAILPVDDVPVRLGNQARPGTRTRHPDHPGRLRMGTLQLLSQPSRPSRVCQSRRMG
jgi:hypothetical protein